MRRATTVTPALLTAALLTSALLASVACTSVGEPVPKSEEKVSPPAIREAGVLRVGVDLDHPPFAGIDEEREAGIDIDVASALASELGLQLELVEVAPDEAASRLGARDVDIVMSVRFDERFSANTSFAGSYAASGPVLFASDETTVSPDRLGALDIAVQRNSESFWVLDYELGEDALTVTETLRDAFEAVRTGKADAVAGDGFVCSYLARDFPGIGFAAQLAPATPIGIALRSDSAGLDSVVVETLDSLSADGVLEDIRVKWVGYLPQLETNEADTPLNE